MSVEDRSVPAAEVPSATAVSVRRHVLTLALPALGEQLLNFCVGLFDTWLAAYVTVPGAEAGVYTATVGMASYLAWLATLLFALISAGTTALVARSWGAGDYAQAQRFANQSLALAGLWGMVICGLLYTAAPWLAAMQNFSGDSQRILVEYLRWDCWGELLFGFCLIGSAALRGSGDMRSPMLILGLVNVFNIGLSSMLVFGWLGIEPWGITGVVGGTVASRLLGGMLMLAWLASGQAPLRIVWSEWRPRGSDVWRLLRIGAPAALDGLLIWGAQWSFLWIVNHLGQGEAGKAYTAAHIIGMEVEAMTYLPAVAWGYAAATLVGQRLGAGQPAQAIAAGHEAVRQACLLALGTGCVYLLGAGWIFQLMSQEPAVRAIGVPALRFISWYQVPLALFIVYLYALRGAGDTRFPILINIVGLLGLRLPLAYLFGLVWQWGLLGVWSAMCLEVTIRAIWIFLRYRSGRWIHLKV